MQPCITQFTSNKLQRRRLESTRFHSSNSSGEEDCLCISVPAEVEKKKKKKLEKSKPVVVEEKDNLHNSIPAEDDKTSQHNSSSNGEEDNLHNSWFVYNSGNPTPTFNSFTCCISSCPFFNSWFSFELMGLFL
jgi:hypothetical protein